MALTQHAQRIRPAHAPDRGNLPAEGRQRVVIERVSPSIDDGRFPAKRVVNERVVVEADIFADGHDEVAAVLRYRHADDAEWLEASMARLVNDRWTAAFTVKRIGMYEFTIVAWIDRFATWKHALRKRIEAGQNVRVDLRIGAALIGEAAARAAGPAQQLLMAHAAVLREDAGAPTAIEVIRALDGSVSDLIAAHLERLWPATLEPSLRVAVDRPKARFSTWYELFPRSTSPEPGRHGTLKDVEAWLPYVARMGFDVLYLPPIHPIGRAFRKGRNNAPNAAPDDVGSPWAIGSLEMGGGGHKSVHPQLGTLDDFDHLVAAARRYGIEIALDIALQCAPDHPYVKEHPEWFRARPDGTIQYAENPPKKYQDIYPFDFESDDWEGLWRELKSIFEFWLERGVSIFRVDNPHTKSLRFWEWAIAELTRDHPDAIFLAEAFTRPAVMYRLAKAGFTQSYTYFAWRNEPWELERYFTELTQTNVIDFFRANLWPNTPDILTAYLQEGGRPACMIRAVLAATLAANYGIYGPAFELCEVRARETGSEEYLDSEKYQTRTWDLNRADSLADFIARLNCIRRDNPALQQDRTLRFHRVDNPALLCYSKKSDDGANIVVCVVNTDRRQVQWGTVELDLAALGVDPQQPYQMHDLLTDARYTWQGPRNAVGLDPAIVAAHVFLLRTRARSEHDFEYFL